jgi:hypothetical protein
VNIPDAAKYPLCAHFLSGYLKANPNDADNFPPDQFPEGFQRYEILFHDALFHLKITKDAFRAIEQFNFDSGDANNLESAIGVLRAAIHLGQAKYSEIALIKSKRQSLGADLTARRTTTRCVSKLRPLRSKAKAERVTFLLCNSMKRSEKPSQRPGNN